MRSLLALVVGFAACLGFAQQIFHFMTEPVRKAFPGIKFIYTEPAEAVMLYMKMAFFVGIFVAAPYVLYQVWAFISPGLYPHEKGWAVPFVAAASVFFALGAAFGHYYLFPITFRFLGEFGGPDMTFMPRISEYYSFYFWLLLGLGAVFQMAVVIFVLARIGLVTIVWQIEEVNDDTGRRLEARKQYNLSLHEKATLRKDLESWPSRKFTDEELKGFDLEKLVTVNCQLQIVHDLGNDTQVYANVQAVVPPPKGSIKLVPLDYVRQKDRAKEQGNTTELTSDVIPF